MANNRKLEDFVMWNSLYYSGQGPAVIDWYLMASNPHLIYLMEQNLPTPKIEYAALKARCAIYKEQLMQKAMHPDRIKRYIEVFGISPEDLDRYI